MLRQLIGIFRILFFLKIKRGIWKNKVIFFIKWNIRNEKFKEIIVSKIPSGRLGEPGDIANAVLFLTSNQSDYINGEIVRIDGGELNKNSGEFNFVTNIPFYEKFII